LIDKFRAIYTFSRWYKRESHVEKTCGTYQVWDEHYYPVRGDTIPLIIPMASMRGVWEKHAPKYTLIWREAELFGGDWEQVEVSTLDAVTAWEVAVRRILKQVPGGESNCFIDAMPSIDTVLHSSQGLPSPEPWLRAMFDLFDPQMAVERYEGEPGVLDIGVTMTRAPSVSFVKPSLMQRGRLEEEAGAGPPTAPSEGMSSGKKGMILAGLMLAAGGVLVVMRKTGKL
jgi:hypothetical protein